MQIKFTKNGVDSSFSGSGNFFKKGFLKKFNTLKNAFFIIFYNKKTLKFWDTIF